jgi:hypothetical protein
MYEYILSAILIIGGILLVFFPYHVWYIKHLWSVDNGTPNESYITYIRVSGGFSIIVGIVWLLIKIFNG